MRDLIYQAKVLEFYSQSLIELLKIFKQGTNMRNLLLEEDINLAVSRMNWERKRVEMGRREELQMLKYNLS